MFVLSSAATMHEGMARFKDEWLDRITRSTGPNSHATCGCGAVDYARYHPGARPETALESRLSRLR
ncbi:hypothetical protein BE11_32215 [Sorangium cellulosum]|nr:hypothetical protein BE11_32215 [Sorangium cellulosum]